MGLDIPNSVNNSEYSSSSGFSSPQTSSDSNIDSDYDDINEKRKIRRLKGGYHSPDEWYEVLSPIVSYTSRNLRNRPEKKIYYDELDKDDNENSEELEDGEYIQNKEENESNLIAIEKVLDHRYIKKNNLGMLF